MTMPLSTRDNPFVAGEKPDPWEHQFKAGNGQPLVLPVGSAARLVVREQFGSPTEKNAAVTDPATGKVTYNWDGTEFPTAGHYLLELWVGNGGSIKYASQLAEAWVRRPVGAVPNV